MKPVAKSEEKDTASEQIGKNDRAHSENEEKSFFERGHALLQRILHRRSPAGV
jgi:hypothetical protein